MKVIATLISYALAFAAYIGATAVIVWVITKIVKAAWTS